MMFHKEIIVMSKLLKVMKISNILPRGSDMSVRLFVIGYNSVLLYVLKYDLPLILSVSFLPLLFG